VTRRISSFQDFRDFIPRDQLCPRHGWVTRYHGCPISWPSVLGQVLVIMPIVVVPENGQSDDRNPE
jgi:hypothetical protein